MPESVPSCCPSQGMLGDLIVWWALSSLILITMNSGRGHCAWWQFCKVPNQTHREIENWKMYAIKQIKICAEYRDMLPRPRLDLSGTPGLRPIGLSPGSWQTSLGLGSMSRYSAQILICITQHMWLPPNHALFYGYVPGISLAFMAKLHGMRTCSKYKSIKLRFKTATQFGPAVSCFQSWCLVAVTLQESFNVFE